MLAASFLGCAPIRPSLDPRAADADRASPAPAPDPAQGEFEARVLPILYERCSPCHFEGGKMYDRLPFDRPGTIQVLGTALFTRIRDEEERQAIREFLGISAEPATDGAPPR